MKAIVVRAFGGPEVLVLEDLPEPRPGPGEVVVRVRAAGVNPVETYLRAGTYTRRPDLPWTPGTDAAGTVLATGEGVVAVAPGDRVDDALVRLRSSNEKLAAVDGPDGRAIGIVTVKDLVEEVTGELEDL